MSTIHSPLREKTAIENYLNLFPCSPETSASIKNISMSLALEVLSYIKESSIFSDGKRSQLMLKVRSITTGMQPFSKEGVDALSWKISKYVELKIKLRSSDIAHEPGREVLLPSSALLEAYIRVFYTHKSSPSERDKKVISSLAEHFGDAYILSDDIENDVGEVLRSNGFYEELKDSLLIATILLEWSSFHI